MTRVKKGFKEEIADGKKSSKLQKKRNWIPKRKQMKIVHIAMTEKEINRVKNKYNQNGAFQRKRCHQAVQRRRRWNTKIFLL